jgi:hypothetical protein
MERKISVAFDVCENKIYLHLTFNTYVHICIWLYKMRELQQQQQQQQQTLWFAATALRFAGAAGGE